MKSFLSIQSLIGYFFIASVITLAGCSGGGGGSSSSSGGGSGSATALTVAESVSVVDANLSSLNKISPLRIGLLAPSDLPADSAYFTDETFVYVEDRSTDAFEMVNEILCMMAQTGYEAMLNQGVYRAQIDLNQCESSRDSGSSEGEESQNQSSGSNTPDYEDWIVDSARTDNASPHIVKVWIHQEEEMDEDFSEPESFIFAKVTITEGKSASNPYGIFTLTFKASPIMPDGTVDPNMVMFKGLMKTELASDGTVLLKFIDEGGFDAFTFNEKVTLNRSADGSTGGGTTSTSESHPFFGSETDQFNFAFDATNFRRVDLDGDDQCFSRTTFDETAWRYGLYDSNGSRVNRNSGFPIMASQNGVDYHGWIGYWGLWFPEDISLNNGDIVNKVTYGPDGDVQEPYTLLKSGGRLMKHVKQTLTLGDITGVPLSYYDPSDQSEYRVEWNGTDFVMVAKRNETTWNWEDIQPPVVIDLTNEFYLHFWSQALGGDVEVNLRDETNTLDVTNATMVIFRTNDMVYPSDVIPTTFVCFGECPNASRLTTDNPYDQYPEQQNVLPADADKATYTFDKTNMVLKDGGGVSVVLTTENSAFPWGLWSGPMFEPTAANLDKLKCDWDPNSTCAWQAHDLTVFYTWETGPNDWNNFTALKASDGTILTFEAPLSVKYTHTGDGYTNTVFYLEYGGFGDLWGIPGKCIDEAGNEVDCSTAGHIRWVPQFTIADGSELINGSDNTTVYLAKALEKEQRMQEADSASCSTLTITAYELPTIAEYTDPGIGDAPEVSGAPAVVGGVVQ